MDGVRNYSSFKQDIKDAFEDLIKEFNFKLIDLQEGYYLLEGAKCNLRFSYDRGVVFCSFLQTSDYKYSEDIEVHSVFRFFYPIKDPVGKTDSNWDTPKIQLVKCSNIIQTNFKNVLNGDFSWLNDFLKEKKREGQLSLFVLDLKYDDPIRKKFWSGDETWRDDVEKYLNENNISLPDVKWG